jgi:hypothetical protein
MQTKAVLPLLYLAPVQYYSKFFLFKEIAIQKKENYNKQSLRNRCTILSANGKLNLSIPIENGRTPLQEYSSVQIAYQEEWQKKHIRAIESAYRNTPFFEFYWDDYLPLFQKKHELLWDLNFNLHQLILRDIGFSYEIGFTENYENLEAQDCAFLAVAKGKTLPDVHFKAKSYYQVFSDKQDFEPNLCILDLIFNEGPNTFDVLKASVVQ